MFLIHSIKSSSIKDGSRMRAREQAREKKEDFFCAFIVWLNLVAGP